MQKDLRQAVASAKKSLEYAEQIGLSQPEQLSELFRKMAKTGGLYPVPNLAVEVCCGALLKVKEEHRKENTSEEVLSHMGRVAYCGTLPRLSDRDGIRDFIACVVHGMAVGVIPSTEGTRLLYGAQVAQAALPSPKRYKKRNKSGQNATGNQQLTPSTSTT